MNPEAAQSERFLNNCYTLLAFHIGRGYRYTFLKQSLSDGEQADLKGEDVL